jgi:hypothetical protein
MTTRSTYRKHLEAQKNYRVRWQDWTGHRPGQPRPRVQHADFVDRAGAEAHAARLRATRGPACLVAIAPLGRHAPAQPPSAETRP